MEMPWRWRLQMLAAVSSAGANFLSSQAYDVRETLEQGRIAVIRLTSTGVVDSPGDRRPLRPGSVRRHHVSRNSPPGLHALAKTRSPTVPSVNSIAHLLAR